MFLKCHILEMFLDEVLFLENLWLLHSLPKFRDQHDHENLGYSNLKHTYSDL